MVDELKSNRIKGDRKRGNKRQDYPESCTTSHYIFEWHEKERLDSHVRHDGTSNSQTERRGRDRRRRRKRNQRLPDTHSNTGGHFSIKQNQKDDESVPCDTLQDMDLTTAPFPILHGEERVEIDLKEYWIERRFSCEVIYPRYIRSNHASREEISWCKGTNTRGY